MNKRANSYSTFAVIGCFLALAAGAAAALAGPLYRLDVLPLREAFDLLRWAAYGGLAAAAASVIGLVRARPGVPRRGLPAALAGLCLGIVVFWIPFSHQQAARRVPAIHDITTDTRNPPAYQAVEPLRPDGANSLEYGGPGVARRQQRAYPDIQPAELGASRERAFDAALAVARDMGWRVVASERKSGRIEAVATTFWFGFKDDVVIRVAGSSDGSRVDVRSVSRLGASDVGKNAARIRAFLEALNSRL